MSKDLHETLKKAYRKGAISKKDYENAINKLKNIKKEKKSSYETNKHNEIILGKVKIVQKDSGTQIIFDTGTEQIPLGMNPSSVNIPAPFFYDTLRMGNYMPLFAGHPMQSVISKGVATASSGVGTSRWAEREHFNSRINENMNEENNSSADGSESTSESEEKNNLQMESPTPPNIDISREVHEEKNTENSYKFDAPDAGPKQEETAQDIQKQEEVKRNVDMNTPPREFFPGVQYSVGPEEKKEEIHTNLEEKLPELKNLKKEVPVKVKETDDNDKTEEKPKKKKPFGSLTWFVKKSKKESRNSKLERIAKENMEKLKKVQNTRKAIVSVAYVLKEFLEVKLEISYSTTYNELVSILQDKKDIHDDIKKEVIGFFNHVNECEYSKGFEGQNFPDFYKSAWKIIEELSD